MTKVQLEKMSAYTWYYFRRPATEPKMQLLYGLTAKYSAQWLVTATL